MGTFSSVPVYHGSGEQVFLSMDLIFLLTICRNYFYRLKVLKHFSRCLLDAKGISVQGAGETRCFHGSHGSGVKRQFFEWIIQKIPSLSFASII